MAGSIEDIRSAEGERAVQMNPFFMNIAFTRFDRRPIFPHALSISFRTWLYWPMFGAVRTISSAI